MARSPAYIQLTTAYDVQRVALGNAKQLLQVHSGEGDPFAHVLQVLVNLHETQEVEALEAVKDFRRTCDHDWRLIGEGRHGSDKGDQYYQCSKCCAEETR